VARPPPSRTPAPHSAGATVVSGDGSDDDERKFRQRRPHAIVGGSSARASSARPPRWRCLPTRRTQQRRNREFLGHLQLSSRSSGGLGERRRDSYGGAVADGKLAAPSARAAGNYGLTCRSPQLHRGGGSGRGRMSIVCESHRIDRRPPDLITCPSIRRLPRRLSKVSPQTEMPHCIPNESVL